MDQVEAKIRRLSISQLKVLSILVKNPHSLMSSTPTGEKIGITGKALGGVFSSLSRQKINKQSLLTPFGRDSSGRGLRWKLNTNLISVKKLKKIVQDLLRFES